MQVLRRQHRCNTCIAFKPTIMPKTRKKTGAHRKKRSAAIQKARAEVQKQIGELQQQMLIIREQSLKTIQQNIQSVFKGQVTHNLQKVMAKEKELIAHTALPVHNQSEGTAGVIPQPSPISESNLMRQQNRLIKHTLAETEAAARNAVEAADGIFPRK
jgi:hypothetical protein